MIDDRRLNFTNQATEEVETPEVDVTDVVATGTRVILYNDNWHTFDEVINQLLKAIKCSQEKAEELTWEVHSKGKACVYEGDLSDCLKVSSVLEEIGLHTQIEY